MSDYSDDGIEDRLIQGRAKNVYGSHSTVNGTIITEVTGLPDIPVVNVVGENFHGLTTFTAAVFIVAEIAGAGVLALPYALSSTGWIGPLVIVLVGIVSIYTGSILCQSWLIVQQRYPEYRGPVRYPYSATAYAAFGMKGRVITSIAINVTLYGATVVFLIMAAENVHDLLKHETSIEFCYWLMIVTGILLPITCLGTPKDFWFFAIGAMLATVISCIIVIVTMGVDYHNHPSSPQSQPTFDSFSKALGTILFAFGGHPAFPTFQTDMKVQSKFRFSVGIAYICILIMYLPVAILGFVVYGSAVNENLLLSLPSGVPLIVVEALITCHLLFAYVIVINPVCQDFEDVLKIPRKFTWKRILSRMFLVLVSLFIAESIPKFGAILSLVGGSTTNILAYIAPPLLYMKLASMDGDWPKIRIPLHIKVANVEIMIIGLIGGVASTYSAILSIASPDSFTVPCFLNVSSH